MISAPNQEAFKQAMRRLAATVTMVATGQAPHRSGLTATAVCSLTANPPQVIACLNASSSTCAHIRETGVFSVNILPNRHQAISECFSGTGHFVVAQRFKTVYWIHAPPGLPFSEHLPFGTLFFIPFCSLLFLFFLNIIF